MKRLMLVALVAFGIVAFVAFEMVGCDGVPNEMRQYGPLPRTDLIVLGKIQMYEKWRADEKGIFSIFSDPADRKEDADRLHPDLISELGKKGFRVLDAEDSASHPNYLGLELDFCVTKEPIDGKSGPLVLALRANFRVYDSSQKLLIEAPIRGVLFDDKRATKTDLLRLIPLFIATTLRERMDADPNEPPPANASVFTNEDLNK